MAMKKVRSKNNKEQQRQTAQEKKKQRLIDKENERLNGLQEEYDKLFKDNTVTLAELQVDYKNNYNEMMNNLTYTTDSNSSLYQSAMEEARANAANKPSLTIEDFEPDFVDGLKYSEDENLNAFFDRALAEGNNFEQINARINAGFRGKGNPENKLTEEQFNMAKKMLGENEDFIKNIGKSSNEVIEQTVKEVGEEVAEGVSDVGNPYLKQVFSGRNLNALLNLGFAVSDYNEARNAGDGVLKAGVKAGAQFVAGEMMGMAFMPVMLAKQVPTLAISAIETTQNVTRKMNSVSRIQTFGEAQFQDTQQLATMRQAGMELAKMSQYNLQQSIMGNEAQYMHKL